MKSTIVALAAVIALLPAAGESAPKEFHAVIAAEEQHDEGILPQENEMAAGETDGSHEESIEEELDAFGDASLDERDEDGKFIPVPYEDAARIAEARRTSEGWPAAPLQRDDAAAYGDLTAIAPVTLKGGNWIFIEGDEQRGWFFDRSMMAKNSDGTISYWQLILYNDLGRAQFADAMHDEDYERLGYTLQRRVLSLKERTIRTYDIIAYDAENAVITKGDREGHAAEIRPNTMAEKEFNAVKKAARKLK